MPGLHPLYLLHFGRSRYAYTGQDIVKALFADPDINSTHRLAAVNSINWARILAQITYYFASYFTLARHLSTTNAKYSEPPKVRFVVPTGNFGDILAGYFAKRMGLPADRLVIATNENDILHRFWRSGYYEKKPVHGRDAEGGFPEDGVKAHEEGVKETLAPAMDILVSSNFERLLWFLSYRVHGSGDVSSRRKAAGEKVKSWLAQLKDEGGFNVEESILAAAKEDFESERVSDKQTLDMIKQIYQLRSSPVTMGTGATDASQQNGTHKPTTGTVHDGHYILDPHSAIGVAASLRSASRTGTAVHHVSLATAHPAKFSSAVETALGQEQGFSFETVLPEQFVGLDKMERRCTIVKKGAGFEGVRAIVREEVEAEMKGKADTGAGTVTKP